MIKTMERLKQLFLLLILLLSIFYTSTTQLTHGGQFKKKNKQQLQQLQHNTDLRDECIFLGCSCSNSRIRCPSENATITAALLKMSMFPKRRIGINFELNLTIDLSQNDLQQVPDDRFAGLDIRLLNFSGNRILKLSPDTFRDVARLNELDLSANKLKFLQNTMFVPIEASLLSLKLDFNLLSDMEPMRLASVFWKLNRLRNLSLAQNRLFFLPNLSRLQNLFRLDLRANLVEFLADPETNENLLPINLIELDLQSNRLKQINERWFNELRMLRSLNLEANQISQISENSFSNLKQLQVLKLNRNNLKHIPSKLFFPLINLEQLELSSQKAKIERIEDFAFDRLSNERSIKRIDLSNNQISRVDNRAFCAKLKEPMLYKSMPVKPYANIKEIDFSYNAITTINVCILRQLAKGYTEIRNVSRTQRVKLQPSKVLVRTTASVNSQFYEPSPTNTLTLMECSCDVTRANKLLDLEGSCVSRADSNYIFSMKHFECRNDFLQTVSQINTHCYGQEQYECDDVYEYNYVGEEAMTTSFVEYNVPVTSTPLQQHFAAKTASSSNLDFSSNSSHSSDGYILLGHVADSANCTNCTHYFDSNQGSICVKFELFLLSFYLVLARVFFPISL